MLSLCAWQHQYPCLIALLWPGWHSEHDAEAWFAAELGLSGRPGIVNWLLAGDSVSHTVVIHNTGNAKLRIVTVTTVVLTAPSSPVTGLTAYSCKLDAATAGVALTSEGLEIPKGSTLACTAAYAFNSISLIEAGNLTFAATVDAADYSSPMFWMQLLLLCHACHNLA